MSLMATNALAEEKTFSHEDLATVLESVVSEQGLVNYQALSGDRTALDRYVKQILEVSPKNRPELFPGEEDQLAYYINAYNALVLDKVLEKGLDRDSVWGFTGTGYGFFVQSKVKLGGKTTNLKDLEDDIIRQEFEDPRIHAAINCASLSCPALPQMPFLPGNLSAQLDRAMQSFVADERNVREEKGELLLSKIFDWFRVDFIGYEQSQGTESPALADYINRFLPDDRQLDRTLPVTFLEYDKGLNRQP